MKVLFHECCVILLKEIQMSESNYSEIFKNELAGIYSQIVREAKEDAEGIYWEVLDETGQRVICEDIYTGTSGIINFLLEYYNLTKKSDVLKIISKSASWLFNYCMKTPNSNYAFYTGRVGTVYTLIKVWQITNNEIHIPKTLKLIENICPHLKESENDLLNGNAGTILGLLFIYDETKDQNIKQSVINITKFLIQNVNITHNGFFWNKSSSTSKGLCGISHGSGGIGLVLLELGKYFNNKLFKDIARKAFDYENHFYNESENNWPDFRTGNYDLGKIKANNNLQVNNDFFLTPRYVSSWCHGAPGIGLTRIRAYEILGDEEYLKDIVHAGKNIITTNNQHKTYSSCLCHGVLGNNSFFLEMYKRTRKDEYLDLFRESCLKLRSEKETSGFYIPGRALKAQSDFSLFLGLSGVGYSFIQALKPKTFSYLLPVINTKSAEKLSEFTKEYFAREMILKLYPLTFKQIEKKKSSKRLKHAPEILEMTPLNILSSVDDPYANFLYEIEEKRNELSLQIPSYSLLKFKKEIIYSKLESLLRIGQLDKTLLIINEEVLFYKWNKKSNKVFIILYPGITEYQILNLEERVFLFLENLKKPKSFESAFSELLSNKETQKLISKSQLIEFIQEGIISIQ